MIRRRCGESVWVGPDIEIRVLEVSGGRVKLGIAAPRDVLVLRDELKMTEDFNRLASRGLPPDAAVRLAAVLSYSSSQAVTHPRQIIPQESCDAV